MPMTPERTAAHAAMEAAIDGLIAAYNVFAEGQLPFAWVLTLGGTRFMSPDLDEECFDADDGDEEESVTSVRGFAKRGQQPVTTRGLLEMHIDRWRG